MIVSEDQQLQKFLTWLHEKSCDVVTCYQISSIRALYFHLSLGFDDSLSRTLDYRLHDVLLHDTEMNYPTRASPTVHLPWLRSNLWLGRESPKKMVMCEWQIWLSMRGRWCRNERAIDSIR
jgi:hypothetical protein